MISRRNFVQTVASGGVALAQSKPRFNIVYVHSHDTGRYIQPYGYAVPTPNMQKLAEQGTLFRQAFDAAPTCSPSRASLLSGCCPHSNGMLGLAHRGFSMRDYNQHMVHSLRAAGYHSALLGVQHIARNPTLIGYDKVVRPKTTHVEGVIPGVLEFLKNAPRNQPFFADIGFQETHREYPEPGPNEDPRYSLPPHPIPDTPQTRYDFAAFKASARIFDSGVGEVMKALEANGLAGNTLIICTTDHGIAFPDMKCSLTDNGTGVLLIMRGPNNLSGGKVIDAMVSHLDIYPTLCELLDIEKPKWLEGRSMMPLVRGEAKEINQQLFAEVNYHASYEPKRAVRTHRYKYIKHFDNRSRPNLTNCDDGLSKTYWLDKGWKQQPVPREQLFDLVFDPNEVHNLAADDSKVSTLADMRQRLETWMRATNDPVLQGPVAAPEGALANDPDGITPNDRPEKLGCGATGPSFSPWRPCS